MTVPVTFASAISLARFGPLRTPTLFLEDGIFILIISDIDLKGSHLIPLVQDITWAPSSTNGEILLTIFSNIILGVAINMIFDFLMTDFKFSEASILDDN